VTIGFTITKVNINKIAWSVNRSGTGETGQDKTSLNLSARVRGILTVRGAYNIHKQLLYFLKMIEHC